LLDVSFGAPRFSQGREFTGTNEFPKSAHPGPPARVYRGGVMFDEAASKFFGPADIVEPRTSALEDLNMRWHNLKEWECPIS
jgi:hypothetical protein